MNDFKLICCIMGGNCEKSIDMCIKSVEQFDKIIMLYDTSSKDKTINKLSDWKDKLKDKLEIYNREYDHSLENEKANGEARNYYLSILKEKYSDGKTYCLVLDADEVLDDNGYNALHKYISEIKEDETKCICSVKMRHFIYCLGLEDNTKQIHFVLNRLFLIDKDLFYPEIEHPVLSTTSENTFSLICDCTTIWHLSNVTQNLDYINDRYTTHMSKALNTHNPEFLKSWKYAHMFGRYPIKLVNVTEIPSTILNYYNIDKDEFYFENRQLEVKHIVMMKQWKSYLQFTSVNEYGPGLAPYGYACYLLGVPYDGIELSNFAVNHSLVKIQQGNIVNDIFSLKSDLVLAFDILEHINYKDLDKAIKNIIESTSNYVLISVPVIGDDNLESDTTHIIKETKEWWLNKFKENGLIQIETPNNFLFKDQIFIFKIK